MAGIAQYITVSIDSQRLEAASPIANASRDTPSTNTRNPATNLVPLAVEAQQVVQWLAEPGDRGEEIEGVMRTMPVVVVEESGEAI